jgi:hypothetical protein
MDLMRLAAGRYGLYISTSLGRMRIADIEQLSFKPLVNGGA